MTELFIACVAFVGSHSLLSHTLRAPLVAKLGEGPFLGLYSLVAFAALGWIAYAFYMAPKGALLWNGAADASWITATIIMLVAATLFAGSTQRNPAAPDPKGVHDLDRPATGMFAITRHPMMWAFALWGIAHILVWPTPANILLSVAIILLALGGAAGQDRKKERLFGEDWRAWEARTSYWPFARQLAGLSPWSSTLPSLRIMLVGIVLWLAATLAHGGIGAGIWRWLL